MTVTSSSCPVPPDQLPINEYQDMKASWFYQWGSRPLAGYLKPLVVLGGLSGLIAWPVAAASFAPGRYPLQFAIWTTGGMLVMPVLTLVQLYLGWLYVGQRLRRQEVPYEESGWYDGQIWVKPTEVLTRDRLIMDYEVQPILRRVQKTFGVVLAIVAALVAAWQFI
jgi:hypothetical protein